MKSDYQCFLCKKTFQRYFSQVRTPEKVFCSHSCRSSDQFSGNKNPKYKDGRCSEIALCGCGKEKDLRADQCSRCSKRSYSKDGSSLLSKEQIEEAVKESTSFDEAASKLGVSRPTATRFAKEYGVPIDHFRPGRGRPTPEENFFCVDTREGSKRRTVKRRIIQSGLLDHTTCSSCLNKDEWNGKFLSLDLDHINGNPRDNRIENLRFLCPNCHSQTATYKGKRRQ